MASLPVKTRKKRPSKVSFVQGTSPVSTASSSVVPLPRIKEQVWKVDDATVSKFLNGQLKVRKLTPLPELRPYDGPFARNPLLKFKLSAGKARRVYEFLEEQADPPVDPLPKSKLECHRLLRQFASSKEPPPLQASWIHSIQRKLHGLHLRFPDIAASLLAEVKDIFRAEMHEFGINLIVKPLPGEPIKTIRQPRVDSGGKTSRYPIFVRRWKYLKSKLYILHPLQRQIYMTAVDVLPETLTDFASYRSHGALELGALEELVYGDLKRAEHLVTTTYYGQVVAILEKRGNWQNVPSKIRPNFLHSARNILQGQITSLIYRSIEHLLWLTGDEQRMPHLKLNIVCDTTLHLLPSQQKIYKVFHAFLDELANSAQKLAPLETWVDDVPIPKGNISISVNKQYMDQAHATLQRNLENVLGEINNYMAGLMQQHEPMFSKSRFEELAQFITGGHSFEELVSERAKFQDYMDSLDDILVNDYFGLGRICQYDLIKTLKELSTDYCNILMNHIFEFHALENRKICQTFQELKEKALKEPDSTEELIDMGNFMLGASAAMVQGLEDKIFAQLQKMSIIIHLAEVPYEYMALMSQSVNWITEIKPVFEQNTAQYEQQKFEFEERLQRRTETLTKDLDELGPKLIVLNNMDDTTRIQDYLLEVRKFLAILEGLDKDVQWINHEEFLFKFPVSTYPELDELHNFINPFAKLLFLTHRWQWKHRVWMNGSFQDLDASVVEATTEKFFKDFTETQKMYKAKIKQQVQDNVARRFKGNVDDPDPNNVPVPIKICNRTLEHLKEFKVHVPLVKILCNKALMQRHWDEMSLICGFDITPDYGTTLGKVIKMDLAGHLNRFEVISIGACKELCLSENLKNMWREWAGVEFTVGTWKDTELKILADVDSVQALLDEHLVKTITMRGSAFVKPFEKDVVEWYNTLDLVNKTLELWERVQREWIYMLPVFLSPGIADQIVEEANLFLGVDVAYKEIITTTVSHPKVLERAGSPLLSETLRCLLVKLDIISTGVSRFIENKRLLFPRFFFLSDDHILDILANVKDQQRVQPHLSKCFQGISSLKHDRQLNIEAMISGEGEIVELAQKVPVRVGAACVEVWLSQLEEQMKLSVTDKISAAIETFGSCPRDQWLQKWPGQVVLCVSAVSWTARVHSLLEVSHSEALGEYLTELQQQLDDIANMVRGTVSNLMRTKLAALIVMDVHARDVVEALIADKVTSDSAFSWQSQLRFYWLQGVCSVRMLNASFNYGCEYLGNSSRLVITPQTDRCYRTLISAYALHLNGAPTGPANSGKTELCRELAKTLAVQCVVFSCSDALDYAVVGQYLKGMASSGAWLCFDDFDRMKMEVMSVVAQQISTIMQAIKAGMNKFVLDNAELNLNPACFVCTTLNPGLPERSLLPDNLKVLFRPVAMMCPDVSMISEVLLHSIGVQQPRYLATKIDTIFRLSVDLLSVQPHYDFSVRSVKTVLDTVGRLLVKFPSDDEQILLVRAIVSNIQPKLLKKDVPRFFQIIKDLFPEVNPVVPDDNKLSNVLEVVATQQNLQLVDYFREKISAAYDMMQIQRGVMLVGESYGGKSSILRVLAEAMGHMGQNVEMVAINPKSVSVKRLFGSFEEESGDWKDGLIVKLLQSDASYVQKWIIFDGPIDATWVENFNSVFSGNRMCLDSGEVIAVSPGVRCIFETLDLNGMSPATVSRCGVICMEPKVLGWQVLALSWLTKQKAWVGDHRDFIWTLLNWIVPPSITFLRKNCVMLVKIGDSNKVAAMLKIAAMLVIDACKNQPHHIQVWIQAALLYGGVWGLGGALDQNSRVLFSDFYLELWRGNIENCPIPECLGRADVTLPTEGTLYDYCYSYRAKGNWRQCADILKQEKIEEPANLAQMVVPTVDTVRYNALIQLHVNHAAPFLLVGGSGTGKSCMVRNYLINEVDKEMVHPAFVTFTASTTAEDTQKLIISKLIKRKRSVYGPPVGHSCVLFIDDVNLPAKELHGAQPAVEFVRQFMDYGYWHDDSLVTAEDVVIMSAMRPTGGNCQTVTPRLLRHFHVFTVSDANDDSMSRIFSSVLFAGLKRNGFASDAMAAVGGIVNATMDVFTGTLAELRPTPNKSHYMFNLRDFAKVVQGCALIKKESVDSRKTFAKLWVHETMRVFYDRLVDDRDRAWMYEKIRMCVKEHLKENFDHIFDNLKLEDGVCTEASLRELMFGNYLDQGAAEEDRKYEEISSVDQLLDVASTVMNAYNLSHSSKLDLVLFKYALEHLSRICRILALPGGSSLLVGLSGSGRQTLTRLATAMMGYQFFQPEIATEYTKEEWRNDLRKILKDAGGLGRSTTFLFSESQIKDESFMFDIDALLSQGEVPELFGLDEKQDILKMVRLSAQGGNRNLDISPSVVFNFFIARCKQRLHLLLCFSPISSSFRSRLRTYSSLVNYCTINWFLDWPVEALDLVAKKLMVGVNLPENIKSAVVFAGKYYHTSAKNLAEEFFLKTKRRTYVTSAAFLELISSFSSLTNKTQEETKASQTRYVVGLEKLQFAANQVITMSKELSELKPKLEAARSMTLAMMDNIEVEKKKVESAAALVKNDEVVANEQAAAAMELKAECEADLAQAIPILEEAIAALNTLKPTDITLVKSMKNPPDAIKLVMAAVCVMKDVKPDRQPDPATGKKVLDYWGPSKRILGDMAFLQQLKEYDKDNISPDIMVKIRREYIPHKDFKPNVVAKASSAAEGLCKWVIAMDLYDAVAKEVAPKKAKLEVAEKEYAATMVLLNQKRAEVTKLEEQLGELMQKLQENQEKKQKLEDDVNQCANKLNRAEKLIDGLGGEKCRWEGSATRLQQNYDAIAGDVLVSCGVISYLSPYTLPYRQHTIQDWCVKCEQLDIPCSPDYTFSATLGSQVKIQKWGIFGLPKDQFSIDNAIILDVSKKWPLLFDPHGLANKWIKTMEKGNGLEVVKISDKNYMHVLIDCIKLGKPALLENITESLDPALDPILNRVIFEEDGKYFINIREAVMEYNSNFKLYLTSRLRNPHFHPEVCNKVRMINFALTSEGLEEKLLDIVVAKERPDLQKQREELMVKSAKNKQDLLEVEAMILQTLSGTKGNILEDENAIETLDSSKIFSQAIKTDQKESEESEKEIEYFRSHYRPTARHSAVMYFCIADLLHLDPMYQYSLAWFIKLFYSSIASANKSSILERRLHFLRETFTYDLYTNVSRSLFEKDKLMFAFLLCCKILIADGKLALSEFEFMVNGVDAEAESKGEELTWLKESCWQPLSGLSEFPAYAGLLDHLISNSSEWLSFRDLESPTYDDIPLIWRQKLTAFQKFSLLRILRPDRVPANICLFVSSEMGEKYAEPPAFDLAKSFTGSNCLCPLVFILSPGSDPMKELAEFAGKKGALRKFKSLSLGHGQGPLAAKLIIDAQIEGNWVCLQNCHLAASWMPTLEKMWEAMDTSNTALEFRLWLTSFPSEKFPNVLLRNSVKITNEEPSGLQANMLRLFSSHPVCDKKFFHGCPGKNMAFGKLLYGLAFFHSVIQGRGKFGSIGWNLPYEFDMSDFQITVQQLQTFVQDSKSLPLEEISYLASACNYGGHVSDEWDIRALGTLMSDFINSDVVSSPNYTFARGALFGISKKANYEHYLEHIKSLPVEPSPEVFGLHGNVGIVQGLESSRLLFDAVKAVEGVCDQVPEKNPLALVDSILCQLPDAFNLSMVMAKYATSELDPVNDIFLVELKRYNVLISVIRESMISVKKSVDGFDVMSVDVENILICLQNKTIPDAWKKASYSTLKPLGSFLIDLRSRLEYFQNWVDQGEPSQVWISGFYSSKSYLTAVLLKHARKNALLVDRITFDFEVLSPNDVNVDFSVVFGMFTYGARWDPKEGKLVDLRSSNVLWEMMPSVTLKPVLKVDLNIRGRYECPLFETLARCSKSNSGKNFVVPFLIETDLPCSFWIKRGCALVCQTD